MKLADTRFTKQKADAWRTFGAFFACCLASAAAAAPDEERLGKSEGYPVCPRLQAFEPRCLIGTVSHLDDIFTARKVAKGAVVQPLGQAEKEPQITYSYKWPLQTVDDYLARNRSTGLLILKDNAILLERYQYDRRPEDRMTSYSMAKTIVAMLIGIALHEGRIKSLDDRAEQYVPELKGSVYGGTLLRYLLTMSSGVRFTERYDGNDDVAALARATLMQEGDGGPATVRPFNVRERAPGREFHYSSAETQVLGLVLRAAVGMTLAEYTSEKIWQPMGAEADASWVVDRSGYEVAYACFQATLRDYARFGLLLANDGALDGKQIIPADWVRTATSVQAPYLKPGTADKYWGYGYQTWLFPGAGREFGLRGVRGQAIFVDPRTKIVMVHTSAFDIDARVEGYREQVYLWFGVLESLAN